ncbi:GNAT family N-acetyltransferase [Lentilactobacillus sp. Marseille-Q4993]|uniref:GNAT family N-acetyltransferase n=1 Tax=Lentilactobacillus sp. Marseille-Q4993 TaxID=3039492 RepID=UPI0024BCC1C7|nr:GNAT family N-acetyltransferase [Lentilactobacillus sp. Marseille-Q4993]
MEVKQTNDLDSQIYKDARMIRRVVFIEEQSVPEELEFDGSDGSATHFVAYENGQPAATARATVEGDSVHIQRVSTMKNFRGQGIAKAVLQTILADPRFRDVGKFHLGAQETAIGFYKKLGFRVTSDPFMEAGIRHREMKFG